MVQSTWEPEQPFTDSSSLDYAFLRAMVVGRDLFGLSGGTWSAHFLSRFMQDICRLADPELRCAVVQGTVYPEATSSCFAPAKETYCLAQINMAPSVACTVYIYIHTRTTHLLINSHGQLR